MRSFVAPCIMHPLNPKIRFVSTLIAVAMLWSFAVPVVHLVCGMATVDVAILCEVEEGHEAHMSGQDASPRTDALGSMSAGGDSISECCLVDAAAADRNAFLPSLSQLPTPAGDTLDAPLPAVASDAFAVDRRLVDDTSPPVAFRLLFSVFLI